MEERIVLKMLLRAGSAAVLVALGAFGTANAAPVVTAGNHVLQAAPGQVIQILAFDDQGTTAIQGLNFRAQIGDGGAFIGGTDPSSLLTSVDLITGTIFATNNTGQNGSRVDLLADFNTTTNVGSILLTGTPVAIAQIEFDGTGLESQSFDVALEFTLPSGTFSTDFAGISATLVTGSITFEPVLVPVPALSPGGLILLGAAILGGLLCRSRAALVG